MIVISTDFSIRECHNITSGNLTLYCVGLWYQTISSLPTNTDCQEISPCGDKYIPAVDGYIDHIHVDLNACSRGKLFSDFFFWGGGGGGGGGGGQIIV